MPPRPHEDESPTTRTGTNCAGSLIRHVVGGAVAGCTMDDEAEGCAGIDANHEGAPVDCVAEFGGCNVCGVHPR